MPDDDSWKADGFEDMAQDAYEFAHETSSIGAFGWAGLAVGTTGGRIIGGFIGGIIGGPPGVVVGAAIGQWAGGGIGGLAGSTVGHVYSNWATGDYDVWRSDRNILTFEGVQNSGGGNTQWTYRTADGIKIAYILDPGTTKSNCSEVRFDGNDRGNYLEGCNVKNIANGNGGDDTIYAFGGNDTLNGGSGNDRLYGGDDRDQMNGGAGRDILVGGGHADTFHFNDSGDRAVDFRLDVDKVVGFRGLKDFDFSLINHPTGKVGALLWARDFDHNSIEFGGLKPVLDFKDYDHDGVISASEQRTYIRDALVDHGVL